MDNTHPVFSRLFWVGLAAILVCLSLAGCGGGQPDSAPAAVEAYLQALVDRDSNAAINHTCANWEADARVEYDSFEAVQARLDQPNCQVTGETDGYTLVSCTGAIIANYNGEDQEIDLGERIFQAIEEGGAWRMCGYR
jgi:hypothetical protein